MSWEIKKLNSHVLNIIDYRGKTPPQSENGIPVISAAHVKKGKIIHCGKKFVSAATYEKWTTRGFIEAGDVLITTEAPVGEVAEVPADKTYLITRRVIALQFDSSYTVNRFIKYYLLQDRVRESLSNKSHGSTVPRVFKDDILDIEIPTPPLQTQKRIADILSAYDDLIENNLKRIKLLEQAAQNIYKEWFLNLRFPGHENTPINKKTGLPEGWEKKLFEDVSVNNNRKRIPLNGIERSKRQGDYRYYGATGVMDYIDDYIFEGRFLLVAEDGTVYDKVGNAYTQLVEGKFWVNNHAHIISSGGLPVEYLYLTMKHYPIGHLITGAVQLKLSMKNLKRVKVISPSEEILEKFLSIVNPMINQVFKLSNQNQKLKSARDIILPRLMNRTIEV